MKTLATLCLAAVLTSSGAAFAANGEALLGLTTDWNGVTVQMDSGGCTDKSDFTVLVGEWNGFQTVEFIRLRADTCLSNRPHGTQLNFKYWELGIDGRRSFLIINPVQSNRSLTW